MIQYHEQRIDPEESKPFIKAFIFLMELPYIRNSDFKVFLSNAMLSWQQPGNADGFYVRNRIFLCNSK